MYSKIILLYVGRIAVEKNNFIFNNIHSFSSFFFNAELSLIKNTYLRNVQYNKENFTLDKYFFVFQK